MIMDDIWKTVDIGENITEIGENLAMVSYPHSPNIQ